MTVERKLRRAAARVVDLVLTDDFVYLDNLPDAVEIEIATPLVEVGRALDVGTEKELSAAVSLFLACAAPVARDMPQDLAEAVEDLRFTLRGYGAR